MVLDNCEHVVGGVSEVCDELLERCPRVRLLATSRQSLGVVGERPWILDPLDADAAAELFMAGAGRSVGVNRASMLDRRIVRQVCDRLDNIPLAIELAAARLRVFGIDDLDRRLADQMAILADPRRSGAARQKTMHATIDWSVGLLAPAERELFCRLSVFRGGARLDAVVAVAGGDGGELELLDDLEELIARSLVVRDDKASRARYRQLEPIRQFADGLLDPATRSQLEDRHAAWVQRSVPLLARELLVSTDVRAAIAAESANVVAAIEHLVERHQLDPALRVVGALGYFWFSERPAEGWRLTSCVLDACDGSETPRLRARALLTAGQLLQQQLRLVESRDAVTEAVALMEGEPSSALGWALFQLGRTDAMADRTLDAREVFERALAAFRIGGDLVGTGWTQLWRGTLSQDPDEKTAITAELVEFARNERLPHLLAGALASLAAPQAFLDGDPGRGLAQLAEATALFEELDDTWQTVETLLTTASLCLSFDRPESADALNAVAPLLAELVDRANRQRFVGLTAEALRRRGHVERAAELAWAVDEGWRPNRGDFAEWIDRCREQAAPPRTPISLEEAFTLAVAEVTSWYGH